MKLSLLYLEGAKQQLRALYGRERFDELRDALGFMPERKRRHSLRVGANVADAGLESDAVEAAILHDYIERGGDPDALQQLNISARALRVIRALSIEEKRPGADDTSDVQHHIESMLRDDSIDQHDKNVAIIIKCADRIDNVKKRVKSNKLTGSYFDASVLLFQTLIGAYQGDTVIGQTIERKIDRVVARAQQLIDRNNKY